MDDLNTFAAKHYYAAAGYLRQEIAKMTDCAELLEKLADRLAENGRESAVSATGEPE